MDEPSLFALDGRQLHFRTEIAIRLLWIDCTMWQRCLVSSFAFFQRDIGCVDLYHVEITFKTKQSLSIGTHTSLIYNSFITHHQNHFSTKFDNDIKIMFPADWNGSRTKLYATDLTYVQTRSDWLSHRKNSSLIVPISFLSRWAVLQPIIHSDFHCHKCSRFFDGTHLFGKIRMSRSQTEDNDNKIKTKYNRRVFIFQKPYQNQSLYWIC